MLLTRIIVSILIVPPLIWLVLKGDLLLLIAIQLAIAIMMNEFYNMLKRSKIDISKIKGIIIGILIPAFYAFAEKKPAFKSEKFTLLLLTGSVIFFISKKVINQEIKKSIKNVSYSMFGIIYISLTFSHLIFLQNISQNKINFFGNYILEGRIWILASFFLASMTDTFAYFFGKAFGKKKILPKISPNKSIIGCIGGLFAAIVSAFLIKLYCFPYLSILQTAFLGAISGILAQLGDLGVSLFKREFGVKNTSNILPGHGGLLDRCDSTLFVAPFVYYFVKLFVL